MKMHFTVCAALRQQTWMLYSAENRTNHPAMHAGKPAVPATVAECQTFMIETQQVQNGRVQIVNVHGVLDNAVAELVGAAVGRAAPDAAAGEPHREGVLVVVAAGPRRRAGP